MKLPERQPQKQVSLTAQIEYVKAWFRREIPATETVPTDRPTWMAVANLLGCYDAEDHIRRQTGPIDYTTLR